MQTTAETAALSKTSGRRDNSKGKVIISEDMFELLCELLDAYLTMQLISSTTKDHKDRLKKFFCRLWSADILVTIRRKTTVKIFCAVEKCLQKHAAKQQGGIVPVSDEMLKTVVESFQLSFSNGSVPEYQDALLRALATMLEHSETVGGNHTPTSTLSVLALYPVRTLDSVHENYDVDDASKDIGRDKENGGLSWIDRDPALLSLRVWLMKANGSKNTGAALGTAFVDGMLLSSESGGFSSEAWDPKTGCTKLERDTAKAIILFCTLPSYDVNPIGRGNSSTLLVGTATASELLWPAIHKGLSNAPGAMMGSTWPKAGRVARALLLLENGCRLRVLSGMGNGDLVVDKNNQMMPPPPNIEAMLGHAASFLLHHMCSLMLKEDSSQETAEPDEASLTGCCSRSNAAKSPFLDLYKARGSVTCPFGGLRLQHGNLLHCGQCLEAKARSYSGEIPDS